MLPSRLPWSSGLLILARATLRFITRLKFLLSPGPVSLEPVLSALALHRLRRPTDRRDKSGDDCERDVVRSRRARDAGGVVWGIVDRSRRSGHCWAMVNVLQTSAAPHLYRRNSSAACFFAGLPRPPPACQLDSAPPRTTTLLVVEPPHEQVPSPQSNSAPSPVTAHAPVGHW